MLGVEVCIYERFSGDTYSPLVVRLPFAALVGEFALQLIHVMANEFAADIAFAQPFS